MKEFVAEHVLPLAGVLLAIVLIVASGAWLIVQMGGMASVAPGVHAMIGLGTLMVIVYGVIRWRYYVRLQRAMADGDTPAGASNAATVRRLVGLNLALGVVTMAVAVLAG